MNIYDLPNWMLGVLVIGSMTLVSFILYFAFHRILKPVITEEHTGLAMAVLAVVATMNSLLLAFSAVSVWESFSSADQAVVEEANTIGALARDLAVFDSPEATEARRQLHEYARLVVADEWAKMQEGTDDPATWTHFDRMFRTIGSLDLDTPRHEALMSEVFQRTNELLKQRRTRLYTAQSEVPGTLWAVVLISTALSLVTTFVLPPTRFNLSMIAVMAISIGLVFYFIVAMDRPFAGKESISSAPFESALANMERWDREVAQSR